jgi:D-amino peptidase
VGEIGIEAAYAGHYGVPVIMVSGDQATAEEARTLLGDVECATVKWGIGRNKARCVSLPAARDAIREAARRAVSRAGVFKPFQPTLPVTLQLTLYRSDMAEEYAARVGVERVDARTVRRVVHSLKEIHRW